MNDNKKPQPASNNPKQLNESYEYAELRKNINDSNTVSLRVPMTPAPSRPPDRNKNE